MSVLDASSEGSPSFSFRQLHPYYVLTAALTAVLLVRPNSPDLIAQLARATASRATENASWWTSWYGGIATRSYSAVSPLIMGLAGAWTVGAISVIITIVAAVSILHELNRYSRTAVYGLGFGVIADLASGRVTFVFGAALATVALLMALKRHTWWCIGFAILATLTSALAGFFLGLVMLPLLFQPRWRRTSLLVCASLVVTVGALTVLYPTTGYEPMDLWNSALAFAGAVAVYVAGKDRYAKQLSAAYGFFAVLLYVVHSPIGSNILRLPIVFGAVFAATCTVTSRRSRAGLMTFLALWTITITAIDLSRSRSPSADKQYYQPLLAHLPIDQPVHNRIEVVDPATHGPALYVADKLPLARGWERQLDDQQNPIFYNGALNSDTYRQWLDSMAVRWVALPNAEFDYASRGEAALVRAGLPYLNPIWSNKNWTLYQVANYSNLSQSPDVDATVLPAAIRLDANAAGNAVVRVTWTRGMELQDGSGNTVGDVDPDPDGVRIQVPAQGQYLLKVASGR